MAKPKKENIQPIVETQPVLIGQAKKRGRIKGVKLDLKSKSYIEINKCYRIDISDNLNFIVQRYMTKTKMVDSNPNDAIQYKAGEKYEEWDDIEAPYYSSFINALRKILDLIVLDKAREHNRGSVEDFIKLYKETDSWLYKKFESKIKGD